MADKIHIYDEHDNFLCEQGSVDDLDPTPHIYMEDWEDYEYAHVEDRLICQRCEDVFLLSDNNPLIKEKKTMKKFPIVPLLMMLCCGLVGTCSMSVIQVVNNPLENGIVELYNYPVLGWFCSQSLDELSEDHYTRRAIDNPEAAREELLRVIKIACPTNKNLFDNHIHFIQTDENDAWQVVGVQDATAYPLENDHATWDKIEIETHLANCNGTFTVITH